MVSADSTGCCAYLRSWMLCISSELGLAFMRAVLTFLSKEVRERKGASLCSFMGINSYFLSGNSIGSSVWVEALAVGQRGQKASKRPNSFQCLNDRLLTLRALTMLTMEFTSCVRYKAPISTSKSILYKVQEAHTIHKVCTQCKYM